MTTFREIWQRLATTRYELALESEVARERAENHRLRAENRALLNSILGIAGVPPITVVAPDPLPMAPPTHIFHRGVKRADPVAISHAASAAAIFGAGLAAVISEAAPGPEKAPPSQTEDGAPGKTRRAVVPTLRRRSWQQINRTLEFESARKHSPTIES